VKLSVVIPAHNEEGSLDGTISALVTTLVAEKIPHEIVVVNDNSKDGTRDLLVKLSARFPSVRFVDNDPPNGYGFAVRRGLEEFEGDCVAVYMADASDLPQDLVRYYRTMVEQKVDCVFGTRWSDGGKVVDYPLPKRVLNRLANTFIQGLFVISYNDMTNAFKLFRREVIEGLQPLLSYHFNLTVELPLKAVARGYTYAVVPNTWINRKTGESKLKIKEMGSRYLFIVLYCWIEKTLSRGDYHRSKRAEGRGQRAEVVKLKAR
jgi:dolichol-phosphate mannosyltransferase